MFSGKTEELIRRVKRAELAKQKVKVFKPKTDVRYSDSQVVSHNKVALDSIVVSSPLDVLHAVEAEEGIEVVALDEAQFFTDELQGVCEKLASKGIRVIVCGLDMDFEGKPFGVMPTVMSIAEYVTKLHAVCMECGSAAAFSYRKVPDRNQVMLGEKDTYEARCRTCFNKGREEQLSELDSRAEFGNGLENKDR